MYVHVCLVVCFESQFPFDYVDCVAVSVHAVLHEGWCTKESGTQFFGKTNWKKRWFKLVQTSDNSTHLQYYRFVCVLILS